MKLIDKIKKIVLIPELRVLPGCLAFALTLSIVPILTIVFMIINIFGVSFTNIISHISDFIPKEIFEMLLNYIKTPKFSFADILVLIASFIIATKGSDILIISSNLLYKLDEKEYIKRKLKSFKITLLLILLIVITLYLLTFGNAIVQLILGNYSSSITGKLIYNLFRFIKWPISVLFIYFIIRTLYSMAPNKKFNKKFYNNGALFSTIGWSLLTLVYMTYVNYFTSYDIIYGSLSSIIVLIMWLYILSYILIIGIKINSLQIEKKGK